MGKHRVWCYSGCSREHLCHEFQPYVGVWATLGHKPQPSAPALRLGRHLVLLLWWMVFTQLQSDEMNCLLLLYFFWCVLAAVVMVLLDSVGQGFSDSVGLVCFGTLPTSLMCPQKGGCSGACCVLLGRAGSVCVHSLSTESCPPIRGQWCPWWIQMAWSLGPVWMDHIWWAKD